MFQYIPRLSFFCYYGKSISLEISSNISIVGLAISPGTYELPIWLILKISSPNMDPKILFNKIIFCPLRICGSKITETVQSLLFGIFEKSCLMIITKSNIESIIKRWAVLIVICTPPILKSNHCDIYSLSLTSGMLDTAGRAIITGNFTLCYFTMEIFHFFSFVLNSSGNIPTIIKHIANPGKVLIRNKEYLKTVCNEIIDCIKSPITNSFLISYSR